MKILFLGHFDDARDEGVRNAGRALLRQAEASSHQVKSAQIGWRGFWKGLLGRPDVVHAVLTPSTMGLLATRLIGWAANASTIVSAMHPTRRPGFAARLAKQEVVVVQSNASGEMLGGTAKRVLRIPCGVDLTRFQPVSGEKKAILRKQYQLPMDAFVVLHLASLKRSRNVQALTNLVGPGLHVLVVGRKADNSDQVLVDVLRRAGVDVRIEHFSKIEEIFQLSDCYAFPTLDPLACIETPLSVLEAVAVGLPVVTTRFGSLPEIFARSSLVAFASSDEDLVHQILRRATSKSQAIGGSREELTSLDWKVVGAKMQELYAQVGRK